MVAYLWMMVRSYLDGHREWDRWQLLMDHGVVSGGMFYTSYLLACYAWANAKHALALK